MISSTFRAGGHRQPEQVRDELLKLSLHRIQWKESQVKHPGLPTCSIDELW